VFRDNFFHADAHAGNIWVDPDRRDNPRFIALDFGIMGQLSSADQYYLAENFMAIFNRDYRRVAELHVEAGWMPAHIRIEELEAAARAVCEPYFTRPLSEISLGEVLGKLFRTARRYELTLQPQLILMQKTLLTIEGIGRLLDPKIDIWAVARPVLERILAERYSPQRLAAELRRRVPEMMTRAPEVPRLLHAWLEQQVEGRHELQMRSPDVVAISHALRGMQRSIVAAILGVGLLIVAAVLYALEAGGPAFLGVPLSSWVAGIGGLWAIRAALPRRCPVANGASRAASSSPFQPRARAGLQRQPGQHADREPGGEVAPRTQRPADGDHADRREQHEDMQALGHGRERGGQPGGRESAQPQPGQVRGQSRIAGERGDRVGHARAGQVDQHQGGQRQHGRERAAEEGGRHLRQDTSERRGRSVHARTAMDSAGTSRRVAGALTGRARFLRAG